MGAAYGDYNNMTQAPQAQGTMTYDDVISRTAMLIGATFVGALVTWILARGAMEQQVMFDGSTEMAIVDSSRFGLAMGLGTIGMLIGLGVMLFSIFKPVMNPVVAFIYAGGQGLLLGGFSAIMEAQFPGVVVNALVGTIIVFGGMLGLFKFGYIRNSPMFTKIMVGAGFGIFGLMMVNIVSGLLGFDLGLFANDGNANALQWIIAIGLVVWAAFSFVLDFDMIQEGVNGGAPKKFAWAGAFGLTAGLIFLYWSMLRLASYFMGE
ncbi:Bax inhibitor-1/YccA family protein [Haloglycomyces albus]|uniref:Bax inhibitor-1/YccA family protein n=1 Tax=Haloglycomyces albus TaxID=526067 RepID=UPI00046D2643|nr:Bax inhibitor-1/YccA family protein [Haloglycomyces albus]